jgi:hypothetical protein
MKKEQQKAAVASKDAEKPPCTPTPIEAEAIAAYQVAKEMRQARSLFPSSQRPGRRGKDEAMRKANDRSN